MSEERDRLLDALLAETLGGETPPDLTARICERAFARSVWANPWLLGASVVAAAALVAVVVSLSLQEKTRAPVEVVQPAPERLHAPSVPQPAPQPVAPPAPGHESPPAPPPYPDPIVTGSFEVAGGGAAERGATILAREDGALVTLGGYCQVQLDPQSRLRIDGKEKEEEVLLQEGAVTCEVERSRGSFTVKTPLGKVTVTGTKFQVQIRKGGEHMTKQSMYIKVLAGTVLVTSAWSQSVLAAGQEQEQANQGTLTGIVTAKTERNLSIRADHTEEVKQFIPNWIGGLPKDGGGPDKDMLRAIRETPVGSHVRMQWKLDEHLRVIRLEILERPAGEQGNGEHNNEGAGRDGVRKPEGVARDGERKREGGDKAAQQEAGPGEGVLTGKVTAKGESWIEVQGDHQEAAARYTPRWVGGMPKDGGGMDKQMLGVFRTLKVGERIRLTWMEDERLRALKIERQGGGH